MKTSYPYLLVPRALKNSITRPLPPVLSPSIMPPGPSITPRAPNLPHLMGSVVFGRQSAIQRVGAKPQRRRMSQPGVYKNKTLGRVTDSDQPSRGRNRQFV